MVIKGDAIIIYLWAAVKLEMYEAYRKNLNIQAIIHITSYQAIFKQKPHF